MSADGSGPLLVDGHGHFRSPGHRDRSGLSFQVSGRGCRLAALRNSGTDQDLRERGKAHRGHHGHPVVQGDRRRQIRDLEALDGERHGRPGRCAGEDEEGIRGCSGSGKTWRQADLDPDRSLDRSRWRFVAVAASWGPVAALSAGRAASAGAGAALATDAAGRPPLLRASAIIWRSWTASSPAGSSSARMPSQVFTASANCPF